jgi:hypothetical protein
MAMSKLPEGILHVSPLWDPVDAWEMLSRAGNFGRRLRHAQRGAKAKTIATWLRRVM